MQPSDIRQVALWLEAARLSSLELEGPDLTLRLAVRRDVSAGPLTVSVSTSDLDDAVHGIVVKAPVAGILRLQHPYASEPLAELGGEIAAGAVIAFIQIGTIYAPVVSPSAGIIGRMLAIPDSLVGFGAPLVEVFAAS